MRHHGKGVITAAACAKPGDSKKALACADKILEASVAEVRARVKSLGDNFGEEVEE